jgi:hypothetical protein
MESITTITTITFLITISFQKVRFYPAILTIASQSLTAIRRSRALLVALSEHGLHQAASPSLCALFL